ncbi:MAG TPA: tetratricopeptide repeat protein [Longimicrobiales bacterium]|nr:tetratricopeptide repeat protein [Longimicrobiales bacterium]
MNRLRRLIREVHRRSLWQVLAIYGAASYVALEAAGTLTESFGLPDWFPPFALGLLVIGLPIVLATAFVQEGTDGQDAEDGAAPADATDAAGTHHRLLTWRNALGGGVLAFALWGAVAAGWLLLGNATPVASRIEGGTSEPEPPRTIAVLPFTNLSAEGENEYFSDGITEEILSALGQVSGLRVAARTSSFAFKGQDVTAEEIGRRLGVTYLLDGSLRKEGNRVRISAQLVNAAEGYELWSERYERELSSVFAIQDQIAQAIVRSLQIEFEGGTPERLVGSPTDNPNAYELYLRGRHFWNRRTATDLRRAIRYFERAVEADPGYAQAYAGLAQAYVLLPFYGSVSQAEAFERAIDYAERALDLSGSLPGPHAALGWVRQIQFRWEDAEESFRRAVKVNPSHATSYQWRSWMLLSRGRPDEALEELRRARELDPLSHIINLDLGLHFYVRREYHAAIEQLRATLELDPTFAYARSVLGLAYLRRGRGDAALAELERAVESSEDRWAPLLGNLGYAYATLGREDEARELLAELEARSATEPIRALSVAYVHLGLGQEEEALEWLERAVAENDPGLVGDTGGLRSEEFDPLRDDPRFRALLREMNL